MARTRRWLIDAGLSVAYAALAGWVMIRLWADPAQRVPVLYQPDPAQHKWFFQHAARVVTGLEYPFFTDRLNVPDGVNLMANTSMLGLGIPLAPVTLLWSADVSFVLALTAGLAGTAFGWYWVLSRHFVSSPWAAALGGAFCGFGPGIVSHASWHTNFAAQFLVPFIVLWVIKLREPGRAIRNGVILGLLVTYQAFINEEVLLFTAMACGLFLAIWAAQRRHEARDAAAAMARGLGVTAIVATVLLAYPLWIQFFGPMSYRGLSAHSANIRADFVSYLSFPSASISGNAVANARIAPNFAEENTFLGLPLIVLIAVAVWWLRRDAVVRSLALTAAVFAVLSLGSPLLFNERTLSIRGPWGALDRLPILDAVMPARFGLVVACCAGILLALACDAFLVYCRDRARFGTARLMAAAALAMALLPLLPTPVAATTHTPVPAFITSGSWRGYVHSGQSLVPVPIPNPHDAMGMRWATAARLSFAVPGGYFLGPDDGIAGKPGIFGAPVRPLVELLDSVGTGELPVIGARERADAAADVRAWRAAVFVLHEHQDRVDLYRSTLNDLFGPGEQVDDVWVWDVRRLAQTAKDSDESFNP